MNTITNKEKKLRSISVKPDAELDKLTKEEKEKIRNENPLLSDDDLQSVFVNHMMIKALKRVTNDTRKKEKSIRKDGKDNFEQHRNHTIIQIGSHFVTNSTVKQLYDNYSDGRTRNKKMNEIGEDIKKKYNYQKKIEEKIGRELTDDDINVIISVLGKKSDDEKIDNQIVSAVNVTREENPSDESPETQNADTPLPYGFTEPTVQKENPFVNLGFKN